MDKGETSIEVDILPAYAYQKAAYLAEQQIKGQSRAKKKALIEENWDLVKYLAIKTAFRKKIL